MRVTERLSYFVGKLVPGALGFIITALLTRLLAPAEYGLFALGSSIILFGSLGLYEWLGLTALRYLPTDRDGNSLVAQLGLCFVWVTIGAAILALIGQLAMQEAGTWGFALACLFGVVAAGGFELRARLLMARLQAKRFLLINSLRGTLNLLSVTGAAFLTGDAVVILAAGAAAVLLSALMPPLQRIAPLPRADRIILREVLRFGLPFAAGISIGVALLSIDRWMVTLMLGTEALGYLGAATIVAQLPLIFLASGIGPAAFTLAVHAVESGNREEIQSRLRQGVLILVGVQLPAAVGIGVLAGDLAQVMVGAAFRQPVAELAPGLAAAAFLFTLRQYYAEWAFQLARNTRPLIGILSVLLAVNIVLDLVLIPRFGLQGAVIAGVAAAALGLILTGLLGRIWYRLPVPCGALARLGVAAAVMGSVLAALPTGGGVAALFAKICLGVGIYSALVLLLDVCGIRGRVIARIGPALRAVLGQTGKEDP